jgi:surfeit locus 1 family protein
MKTRSLIWPLAFTVPSVLILLAMGFWQVERLAWKEGLIAERTQALKTDPVLLPAEIADINNFNFRRVRMTGHYLSGQDLYLQNINRNSVRGVDVITPFKRINGEGGNIVLINRGWIPLRQTSKEEGGVSVPSDTLQITGIVRMGARGRNAFTPENQPDKASWYSVDPLAMAETLGIKTANLVIEVDLVSKLGDFPVSGPRHYELKNNHLSYALTWFSLAVALLVIFGLFVRRLRQTA